MSSRPVAGIPITLSVVADRGRPTARRRAGRHRDARPISWSAIRTTPSGSSTRSTAGARSIGTGVRDAAARRHAAIRFRGAIRTSTRSSTRAIVARMLNNLRAGLRPARRSRPAGAGDADADGDARARAARTPTRCVPSRCSTDRPTSRSISSAARRADDEGWARLSAHATTCEIDVGGHGSSLGVSGQLRGSPITRWQR